MLITLLIIILLTFGSDAYLCFGVLSHFPVWLRMTLWIPSILLFLSFFLAIRGNWGWPVSMVIILLVCLLLPKFIFCLVSIIGKLASLAFSPAGHWCNIVGILIAIIFSCCGIYGVSFGWRHLVVKNIEVTSNKLPVSFDGFRIAQITDLHLGTFGNNTKYINDLVERINALHPDLVVFTGDLVNFSYTEVKPFESALSKIDAKYGVISILGNHDYAIYSNAPSLDFRQKMLDSLITVERRMGWRLLLDENYEIKRGGDSIFIAGVQNIGRRFSANKGDLAKTLSGIPTGAFTILLSHDPTHWEDAISGKEDIPLTLSGHTHAMQFKVFGWSPSSIGFKHWGGLYCEDDQYLNVSTGAGGNLPFRFGAWPEIVMITLKR